MFAVKCKGCSWLSVNGACHFHSRSLEQGALGDRSGLSTCTPHQISLKPKKHFVALQKLVKLMLNHLMFLFLLIDLIVQNFRNHGSPAHLYTRDILGVGRPVSNFLKGPSKMIWLRDDGTNEPLSSDQSLRSIMVVVLLPELLYVNTYTYTTYTM